MEMMQIEDLYINYNIIYNCIFAFILVYLLLLGRGMQQLAARRGSPVKLLWR